MAIGIFMIDRVAIGNFSGKILPFITFFNILFVINCIKILPLFATVAFSAVANLTHSLIFKNDYNFDEDLLSLYNDNINNCNINNKNIRKYNIYYNKDIYTNPTENSLKKIIKINIYILLIKTTKLLLFYSIQGY